jgi:HSP20 family protein
MPKDTTSQFRDENPHQGASHTFGKPAESGERTRPIETVSERRSVAPGRRDVPARSIGAVMSPFTLMRHMAEDMDRIFQDFGMGRAAPAHRWLDLPDDDPWRAGRALQSAWSPQIETFRRGDSLVVRADLPGMKKDDVEVEVENGVLSISGERSEAREDDRDDYYRSERSYGRFYRAIPLPEGIDGERCDASFQDGVLEVTFPVPRMPERAARKIPIR